MWWNITEKYYQNAARHEEVSVNLLQDFIRRNKLTRFGQFDTDQDIAKFLKTGVNHRDDAFRGFSIPFWDHAEVFKSDSKTCIVYHPYVDSQIQFRNMWREISFWAEQNKIAAGVYPPDVDWYYPGHTALVVLHLQGVIFLPPEKG